MGMVDAYVAAPVLQGPLADIHRHAAAVLTGGLMRLLMSIGVVGIALAFLPVIRRHNEIIAMSYLAFRTAECVLLSLGVCGHVFLIGLSRTDASAGAGDNLFPALADGALGFTRTTYQMAMTILGIGSTLLCWVLLRARLIPAWIAALGIVGYVLLLASAILDLARRRRHDERRRSTDVHPRRAVRTPDSADLAVGPRLPHSYADGPRLAGRR